MSVQVRSRDGIAAAARPPGTGAVALLPVRLVRRGAVLLCVLMVLYVVVEVLNYRQTYPDASSRAQIARFADDPAVRVLQGVPRAVDTVGGFLVWDAGWFMALVVGIWSLLVTTRLLRDEEDKGRADVVLATAVHPVRLLLVQLGVVGAVLLAVALVVGLSCVALGLDPAPSLLLGAGLAGVGATSSAVAAVAAQLFDVRRRAVAVASAVLGLAFVLRMLGSSDDSREALLWLTPFGWLDGLRAFSGERWLGLAPFVVVPALLVALAVRERTRRDTGGSRFAGHDRHPPRVRLLGGPVAFGWRLGQGVLAGWVVGVAVFSVVLGTLLPSVVDLLEEDEEYVRALEQLGIDLSAPVEGFLALMATTMALVFALFVSWRIGALRAEEGSGRLEHLLVRPVVRWRWLALSSLLAVAAAAVVVVAAAVGIWVGALGAGADVSAGQALVPMLMTLPVAVLFTGIAVLSLGAAPRLTIALPVALAVLTYLLDLLATVLDLPAAVMDLSPFRWLPVPPDDPFAPVPALVLVLLGTAAAAVGIALFARRDLQGD